MSMMLSTAMRHPDVFGPSFAGPSWAAWIMVAKVIDGAVLTAAEQALYREMTGRDDIVDGRAPVPAELWAVKGRRGGGSRFFATVMLYLALFRTYTQFLAPGEWVTFPIMAVDRKQARTIRRYITGLLDAVPMLRALVSNETADGIEFAERRVVIEIMTYSNRSSRGYTIGGLAADEVGHMNPEGAMPSSDVIAALRPGMASIPGALLMAGSTPYGKRGILYETYERHFGVNNDPVLVLRATTRQTNPTVPQRVIDEAMALNSSAAGAEFLATFRDDVSGYATKEQIDAVVIPGRTMLPPVAAFTYRGHLDAAGGSGQDSMTAALAHRDEHGKIVLDLTLERRPPFSPQQVAAEFAEVFKQYRVGTVTADRYAGDWPTEAFGKHGITVQPCPKNRSEIYIELLPLITAGQVELLDDRKRLLPQLLNLERKVGRLRDVVDHPPGQHDDVILSAAGALIAVASESACIVAPIGISQSNYWSDRGETDWSPRY